MSELKFPNVHRAASPWAEDQRLYVAAMYSNPQRWRTRRYLFNEFAQRTEAAPGVELYRVEVAYGDRPFEVTEPNNAKHLQLRSSDELWLKENALNLAVQRFPASAQYLAYLDGDILMSRYDWALETVHLLQHYDAVQLFHTFTDLDSHHRPLSMTRGFAYSYAHSILPDAYYRNAFGVDPPKARGRKPIDNHGRKTVSRVANAHVAAAAGVAQREIAEYGGIGTYGLWGTGKPEADATAAAANALWGATGLGWAYRKSTWEHMNRLLDICILGSADWHMAYGMAGLANIYGHEDFDSTSAYVRAIREWQQHAAALKANIWYLDNHIEHFWHGPKSNRFYRERSRILVENQFDPRLDLRRDWQGLWRLAGNKPKLRDDIRAYFRARNEDSPDLAPEQRPLV